ncbi:MAG: DUF3332 family protein [Myxococcota bacterium]
MTRDGRRPLRRLIAVAMIAGFLPVATTACFGEFRLTKKVYEFNRTISPDKWVRWFAFLIMNFVPVYGLAAGIDAVVANSIEFWTGQNPITADLGTTRVVTGPKGETVTLRAVDRTHLEVTIRDSRGLREFTVVKEAGALSAWDREGRLLARVQDVAGHPALVAGSILD